MFGKKNEVIRKPVVATKTSTKSVLSPKVAKADELRREANKAQKKCERIVEEWIAKSSSEKSRKKRKEIDEMYSKKIAAAETCEDKTYTEYHKYVNKNFPKKTVDELVKSEAKKGGAGFMGKGFINRLEKAQGVLNKK